MNRVVLVTGSRIWDDRATITLALSLLPKDTVIIHGDCYSGADAIADEVARGLGLFVRKYPADWKLHGKAAGPIRNSEMLTKEPEIYMVLAFKKGDSPGTSDMIRKAKKAGKKVVTYEAKTYH